MGTVYEAACDDGRRYALKVLEARHLDRRDLRARFEREAQLAQRGLPNLVAVVDYSPEPPFLVMELLVGCDLETCLRGLGALSPAELTPLLEALAAALGPLHDAGVTHRDLKPANVFLHRTPVGLVVKLMDLGIARDAGSDLTSSDLLLGTASYMAPEQARGEAREVGPWTDVFALGALTFRAVTGAVPFPASSPVATLRRILKEPPPDPRLLQPEVPAACAAVLARAMARRPAERFGGAVEVAREWRQGAGAAGLARLEAWVDGHLAGAGGRATRPPELA